MMARTSTMEFIEDGQEARAAAWAKAIWTLREVRADRRVLEIVIHEATWYVPLRDKQPSLHRLRYWSERACHEDRDLRREHVVTRKSVERRIAQAKSENEIRKELASLVVCVVTDEEHDSLRPHANLEGWHRYQDGAAGIRVFDRKLQKPAFQTAIGCSEPLPNSPAQPRGGPG